MSGRRKFALFGIAFFGLTNAYLFLTPFGGPHWAEGARLAFSPICHQEAARSPFFAGEQLAVCHRCSGIYAGLLAGALLALFGLFLDPENRKHWWWALAPMPVHVALRYLWPASDIAELRVITGLLFGAWGASVLARVLGDAFESREST